MIMGTLISKVASMKIAIMDNINNPCLTDKNGGYKLHALAKKNVKLFATCHIKAEVTASKTIRSLLVSIILSLKINIKNR